MESYVVRGDKRLRRGYTTGTCAASAACGAAQMLLSEGKDVPCEIHILTPKGIEVKIPVETIENRQDGVVCCVKKDSGDDPDVTNGALVFAKVRKIQDSRQQVKICGGLGIGKVTKPGLACQVGEPAINPVPRKMITEEVLKISQKYGYQGSLEVEISIPAGVELAQKTFNPKLGIEGGISVLGTSGIVEPMSEQALIDTIKVEINMAAASGAEYLILTPGNYGERFLSESGLADGAFCVKCSNFIGDTLDYAGEKGMKGILLTGHIGKLVKIAAGKMNTHSKYGDGRMETLTRHLEVVGMKTDILMDCVTTEDAIAVIRKEFPQFEKKLWDSVLEEIQEKMTQRVGGSLLTEAVIYSNQYGYLGETKGVRNFLALISDKEEQE